MIPGTSVCNRTRRFEHFDQPHDATGDALPEVGDEGAADGIVARCERFIQTFEHLAQHDEIELNDRSQKRYGVARLGDAADAGHLDADHARLTRAVREGRAPERPLLRTLCDQAERRPVDDGHRRRRTILAQQQQPGDRRYVRARSTLRVGVAGDFACESRCGHEHPKPGEARSGCGRLTGFGKNCPVLGIGRSTPAG
jgi:hypothetical protein